LASKTLPAIYLDGQSSKKNEVQVHFDENEIRLIDAEGQLLRQDAYQDLSVEPVLANMHGTIRFSDGAVCEFANGRDLHSVLPESKTRKTFSIIHKLENHLPLVGLALLLVVVSTWGVLKYGVPFAAKAAAYTIPLSWEKTTGEQVLEGMDRALFSESALSSERQKELQAKFSDFTTKIERSYDYEILFRASPKMGANALALPGGTIIITDELVNITKDDREVIAVLAHEIAHIEKRHMMRHMFQDSVTVLLLVLITGDLESATSLVATLPTVMVQMHYSRMFESEADKHGASLLLSQGLKPEWLAIALEHLEQAHEGKGKSRGFLSSHPSTPERVATLRKM